MDTFYCSVYALYSTSPFFLRFESSVASSTQVLFVAVTCHRNNEASARSSQKSEGNEGERAEVSHTSDDVQAQRGGEEDEEGNEVRRRVQHGQDKTQRRRQRVGATSWPR